MSIKTVNSLSHYTDWTIGHVHSGALGWVAFVSFGALYCLVPWLWNKRELYSITPGQLALLDRDASASCSTSPRCGWRASCRA